MLPVVAGKTETKRQILIYSLLLVPVSLLPWALSFSGALYSLAVAMLGTVLIRPALLLRRASDTNARAAQRLFAFSMLYSFALLAVLLMVAAQRRYIGSA
jgi:protoheme IX farnesyltransferase